MNQSGEIIKFAGEVNLSRVDLVSLNGMKVNIAAQVLTIEIFEDIFSPFMSLSIVLRESVDFINVFPFIGEEYIELSIKTPSIEQTIDGRFYIYKITDRMYTAEREVAYTIKAISEEFLIDANTRINSVISGNIAESARKLMKSDGLDSKKNLIVEKTSNSTKFVSNYWSPVKCLNYLASSASNLENSPSYLFFENRDGLNFISINTLLQNNPYQKLSKDNYSRTRIDREVDSKADVTEDYKRILDVKIPVLTDYMKAIQSGQMKSKLITHDILTKKYTAKDYSVKKDPQPFHLLNTNPIYSKYSLVNSSSTILTTPKHYASYQNFIDTTNAKIVQRRLSFFENLRKYSINVNVLGRTDYTVGQIMDVFIPRTSQISKEDADEGKDEMLSGKYLVSAISHVITRENHTCNLELIKNSTLTSLSK